MSCKRKDIMNLKGCRIGDVAIRGCGYGCCPYPDDKISENTRTHLLANPTSQYQYSLIPPAPGRTGLFYGACQTSWKPKFICSKPECRRSIKPSYDPDQNDYRISEYGDWEVRPKVEKESGLKVARQNQARLRSKANQGGEEKRDIDELWKRFREDENSINRDEFERLKMYKPELWWRKVITLPRYHQRDGEHMVRCPSCGESVTRVGSNFRVPKKSDERSWKEIELMIERGEDMVAKFLVCSTVEEHEEMVEEAQMRLGKNESEGTWLEEKRRRIEGFGLSFKG